MTDREVLLQIRAIVDKQLGVIVTDPPPPPPVLPPAGGPNYALYAGYTRGQLEFQFGPWPGPKWPAGWDWDAAYASGYVLRSEDYAAGQAATESSHFPWGQSGHWKRVNFRAGQAQSFSTDVPAGPEVLSGLVGEAPGSPDTMQIRLWFSLAPEGPAIPGSEYEGAYVAHFMTTPQFHPPAGRVYFNVLLSKSGPLDVKLTHS